MIRPASSDGYINHCNKTKQKSKKKNWGHPFPCNDRNKCRVDNTGMSVSNTPVDSDEYINHCNETKRKSPPKIGDIFSHVHFLPFVHYLCSV